MKGNFHWHSSDRRQSEFIPQFNVLFLIENMYVVCTCDYYCLTLVRVRVDLLLVVLRLRC